MEQSKTVIVDHGSYYVSAGLASSNLPTTIFPTLVGRPKKPLPSLKSVYVGDYASTKAALLNMSYPYEKGRITNFEDMGEVWSFLYTELNCKPEDQPVFLSEGLDTPFEDRQRIAQVMFEKYHVPAVTFASTPILALASSGRPTGVLINCGHTDTEVVPIQNQRVLRDAVQKLGFGGRDLTTFLHKSLIPKGADKNPSRSILSAYNDMKEKNCFVSADPDSEDPFNSNIYELPDGTKMDLDDRGWKVPEAYFKPKLIEKDVVGLPQLIANAVFKAEESIQEELGKNLVLAGGSSLFKGLPEKLEKEVGGPLFPLEVALKADVQRKYASWIGGQYVVDLSLHKDAIITVTEYQEEGPEICRRFFG